MSTEQATTTVIHASGNNVPVASCTIVADCNSDTPIGDTLTALKAVRAVLDSFASDAVCRSLDSAIDEAAEELRDSDEEREWTLTEEGHDYDTVTAASAKEALDIARGNVDRANYDGEGTMWIRVSVRCEDTDEEDSAKVTCEPDEPDCTADEHDWFSPISLVGGIKENPGVHGHGGGVIITEACKHCGCKKVTDTWAQDMSTGEQGLDSVEYEEGAYDVSYWKCDAIVDSLNDAGFTARIDGKRGEQCEVIVTATPTEDLSETDPDTYDYDTAREATERAVAGFSGADVWRCAGNDYVSITV